MHILHVIFLQSIPLYEKKKGMDSFSNAVLIQKATLSDIEAMIDRAVERRMSEFYDKVREKPRELVSRKHAAELLGISLPTLNAYSKTGIIHPVHVGGRVFYDRSEIDLKVGR